MLYDKQEFVPKRHKFATWKMPFSRKAELEILFAVPMSMSAADSE